MSAFTEYIPVLRHIRMGEYTYREEEEEEQEQNGFLIWNIHESRRH